MLRLRRLLQRFVYLRCRISMSTHSLPKLITLVSLVLMLTMLTGMIKINNSNSASLSDDSKSPTPSRSELSSHHLGRVVKQPAVPAVDTRFAREPPVDATHRLTPAAKNQDNKKKSQVEDNGDNNIDDVDVVYTWVNGSDPEHAKTLRRYKAIEARLNPSREQEMHRLSVYPPKSNTNSSSYKCFHKQCVESRDLLVVVPQLPSHITESLSGGYENVGGAQIEHRPEFVLADNEKEVIMAPDLTLMHASDYAKLPLDTANAADYKVYKAFYTPFCGMALNCIPDIERTYILRKVVTKVRGGRVGFVAGRASTLGDAGSAASSIRLPDFIVQHLEWITGETGENMVIKMKNDTEMWRRAVETEDVFEMGGGLSYQLYKASIVWDLGDPNGLQMWPGRFTDNNELKYSLRSLEKNAPWVRKIHIVTNGQVPQWLNTAHPKIRLVTHAQIFTNASYLPTFSSPAIEANLFRIPGLAKRFIYMNDDILITSPVRHQDFWTRQRGFRFQLAWAAPGPNAPPCAVLNTYDCSVRHVCDIYDKAYGRAARRVPAHVPHYFDRDIISSMVAKFPSDFDHTSATRFRQSDNMQFAFSFYYYVMHENKWRFERLGETDMRFFMIQDKSALIRPRLDMFKRRPRKFACFNDDIDYGKTNQAHKLKQMIADFFQGFFPDKSPYEL